MIAAYHFYAIIIEEKNIDLTIISPSTSIHLSPDFVLTRTVADAGNDE